MPTEIRAYIRSLGHRRLRRRRRRPRRAARDPARRRGLPRARRRSGGPPGAARAARPRRGHGGARPARRRAALSRATGPSARSCPPGIELTPPRAERSTGPGHRDFAIVSDASIGLEEDMARRDFTINAMAIRLDGGEPARPVRRRRRPRAPRAAHRRPDELRGRPAAPRPRAAVRLAARLRPRARDAEPRCEASAAGLAHVSAERIGGGIKADGLGRALEAPARARARAARSCSPGTPACSTQVIPEFAPAIGYALDSERQPLPLDEHIFAVVQNAADGGATLEVRLAVPAARPRQAARRRQTDDDHAARRSARSPDGS